MKEVEGQMSPEKENTNQLTEEQENLQKLADQDYKYGFVTDIETDRIPEGLSEDVVRLISEVGATTDIVGGGDWIDGFYFLPHTP